MATEVVMPQMGESITEGTLTKWLKKPGDTVQRDEPLFEISTDKVDAEIPSPAAGTLEAIKIEEGTTVTINTVVCTIAEAGSTSNGAGAKAAPAAKAETAAAPAADSATPAAVDTASANETPAEPSSAQSGGAGTEVPMPQMGESITEGTITKWLKKVGDSVQRDEPLFEISTDKVDAEIPSPVAGVLTEIKAEEGSTVQVNAIVAVIGGATGAPAKAATPAAAPSAPVSAPAQPPGELVPMTKMRSIIAKRMVESKQTSPHVHTVFKVDMTRIVKLREKEKNKYEQRNGVKLTYMPFITRAAIVALRKHPIVNARSRATRSATTRTSTSASRSRWTGA
jgi:pyruvate/2-oxoglutarate dehydrogenase complex dihydrolipoamide acyltransferase (E2) component